MSGAVAEIRAVGSADSSPPVVATRRLVLWPTPRSELKVFLARWRRRPVDGGTIRVGVRCAGELVAVVTAGRPLVETTRNSRVAEVKTLFVAPGHSEALRLLYEGIGFAVRGLGFRYLITRGRSGRDAPGLIAAGWQLRGPVRFRGEPGAVHATSLRLARRWAWVRT